ncbi:MAG: magnesium transporter [Acidobacteriota bacterium]|nr:magnesium transporter [Acidobacteriota bacterium]
MIYFTELENLPVFDAKGDFQGRLTDVFVNPAHNALVVAAYQVRTAKKASLWVSHDHVQSVSVRALQGGVAMPEMLSRKPDESLISVKKDVLDQQIIDVNHRKVERVNDVDFDIRPTDGHTELRIVGVNVGLQSAARRLLQGLVSKHKVRSLTSPLPSRNIPWEFVNLIEPDPARRLKLRISYDRLAQLHPADVADILEELSRDEQKAVIESLDEETAAQAISEIPTRMQAALLESIPAEKASDIIEEMPPDEAADVLQEMPPETSAELLAGMESEEAKDVRGLLGFEEDTAGALMTTDFIAVDDQASAGRVIELLRAFEGPVDSVHQVFLTGPANTLTGTVPLARILLAASSSPLKELSSDPVISVNAHADEKEVVELFHKYNLLTLPVTDENLHLLGVVTADDVLELVVKRR